MGLIVEGERGGKTEEGRGCGKEWEGERGRERVWERGGGGEREGEGVGKG